MVRFHVPSLSSQTYQLAAPVRPVEDYETKVRKTTDDGKPLSRYTLVIFGEYGVSQLVVKAPEIAGADDLKPGTSVVLGDVTALAYAPDGSKSLTGLSISASAVTIPGGTGKGANA